MRPVVAWILILHACHFPIPFPDLDGECRGAPIASLGELEAWHVLMIGVRPNNDVDRGPIRTGRESEGADGNLNPLGDPATIAARTQAQQQCSMSLLWSSLLTGRLGEVRAEAVLRPTFDSGGHFAIPDSRCVCISFCTWQV